jgi:hypothetical protein
MSKSVVYYWYLDDRLMRDEWMIVSTTLSYRQSSRVANSDEEAAHIMRNAAEGCKITQGARE